LLGIILVDFRQHYDVREVIAHLVDGSDFLEFKAHFGVQTVCCHAHIMGHRCGIIGNNSLIYSEGANKAAHFIQAWCQSGTLIIYLHNITGYMVESAHHVEIQVFADAHGQVVHLFEWDCLIICNAVLFVPH
jgi:geranyl-CoA carboxylase beta subunit